MNNQIIIEFIFVRLLQMFHLLQIQRMSSIYYLWILFRVLRSRGGDRKRKLSIRDCDCDWQVYPQKWILWSEFHLFPIPTFWEEWHSGNSYSVCSVHYLQFGLITSLFMMGHYYFLLLFLLLAQLSLSLSAWNFLRTFNMLKFIKNKN